ncbi:glycosyltransferase family 4 protein [Oscillochloris sp. ZM17-4]|uniref:glycosyltransferase family 4 protein n=1 Tax=Oscillochloris sp. ZM17-4 TaxID=2866714 RepID=UPI001C736343|nr:glycosyltransferase family 4 protein [Oscillochloris sp. ZM17-4]MBX0331032.1 glycosyltransferase family 4 protein [Oscillochloris sp. ZM17-4]
MSIPLAPHRILHIIDHTASGGAQVVVGQIAHGLYENYPSAIAALGIEGSFSEQYRALGLSVIQLSQDGGRWNIRSLPALISVIKSGHFDVVHAHLLKSHVFSAVAARALGVRIILHDHTGIYPSSMRRLMKFWLLRVLALSLYRVALHWSDAVIVLNSTMRDAYQRYYPSEIHKIYVIPNAVNIARFEDPAPEQRQAIRSELGLTADTRIILMIGRLDPEKNWWMFLQVAEKVNHTNVSPCAFLVVGEGAEEQALRQYIQAHRLTNVHLLGYRDDIPALLAAADVFLLTSMLEPFGIVLIEAMAAGCPVIATRSGGPETIITHDVDGLLIDIGDVQSATNHIIILLTTPEKRASLALSGRETVRRNYNSHAMLDRVACIYANTVDATERMPG